LIVATASEHLGLHVATPVGLALKVEVDSVQVPGAAGELGILPGHLPVLAVLKGGLLQYKSGGETVVAAVGTGYVEVGPSMVRVLTERFARATDVDGDVVRSELAAAQERLKAFSELHEGPEYQEIQASIDWAYARLSLLQTH
jgi:F-type H+-transporting ATPase subunit epsilon